eukprot:gene19270-biopygen6971
MGTWRRVIDQVWQCHSITCIPPVLVQFLGQAARIPTRLISSAGTQHERTLRTQSDASKTRPSDASKTRPKTRFILVFDASDFLVNQTRPSSALFGRVANRTRPNIRTRPIPIIS